MLIQKIKQDLVSHIKSGDKIKISITRLLIAALKDKEISLRNNQGFDELKYLFHHEQQQAPYHRYQKFFQTLETQEPLDLLCYTKTYK